MHEDIIVSALTGNAGGLATALLALMGLWKFVNNKLIPLAEKYITGNLAHVDRLVSAQEDQSSILSDMVLNMQRDREVWKVSLEHIHKRLDKIESKVEFIQLK